MIEVDNNTEAISTEMIVVKFYMLGLSKLNWGIYGKYLQSGEIVG